ncbi:MAG: restriction endonuclease [Phycisphaerales bacterium]|nr:restriction endonuclease [Phycisphaerales bacterium]
MKPVRERFGVMTSESANRSILVTCGSFSREARSIADGESIALVEGPELWELVQSVKKPSSSSTPSHSSIPAQPKPSPPTASISPPTEAPPYCPKCGALMILREAKKGPNAGSQF